MAPPERPPAADDGSPGLDLGRLRWIAVVAPALFAAGLLAAAATVADDVSLPVLIAVGALAATAAAALFSGAIFGVIERSEAKLVERNQQLDAVRAAAMTLSGEYELRPLLQRFVDVSRELTGARYGAMSVLRAEGGIEEFITSGLTEEERERIGRPPVGRGLLGVIIREGAIRLDDMASDPRSAGFPPNHPPMRSLLGVPVISRRGTIGNLYLTDKEGGASFTAADERMVRTFAAHAALAIETSRLHDEHRLIAVLRERERIGMDLHDGVIQSIYAINLGLEESLEHDDGDSPGMRTAVESAIERLSSVIGDVRSYIFRLRPSRMSYDLSESLTRLVRDFETQSGIRVHLDASPALPQLSGEQSASVFHIAQEALANARKHAGAREIDVILQSRLDGVDLVIHDEGRGFDRSADFAPEHQGLRNMEQRAREARGQLSIDSAPGAGTTVRFRIPLAATEGALL
jgi:signal transduction histidine kinase